MRTRGCNGLSYILEYAKERGKSDEEVTQDGMWKEGVWDMGDVEGGGVLSYSYNMVARDLDLWSITT